MLLALKLMSCATSHDLARFSASNFVKAGINKVSLEALRCCWLPRSLAAAFFSCFFLHFFLLYLYFFWLNFCLQGA